MRVGPGKVPSPQPDQKMMLKPSSPRVGGVALLNLLPLHELGDVVVQFEVCEFGVKRGEADGESLKWTERVL